MIYSTKTRYAIQALVGLANLKDAGYTTIEELSEAAGIPKEFLAKIFQELSKHGMIKSKPGRGGGFKLNEPPAQIELYEVVELIDGPEPFSDCVFDGNRCHANNPCPLHDEWVGVREKIVDFLKENTIADLSEM